MACLECPDCGGRPVATSIKKDRFRYGKRFITVQVPLRTCTVCGLMYLDEETYEIRRLAVIQKVYGGRTDNLPEHLKAKGSRTMV